MRSLLAVLVLLAIMLGAPILPDASAQAPKAPAKDTMDKTMSALDINTASPDDLKTLPGLATPTRRRSSMGAPTPARMIS